MSGLESVTFCAQYGKVDVTVIPNGVDGFTTSINFYASKSENHPSATWTFKFLLPHYPREWIHPSIKVDDSYFWLNLSHTESKRIAEKMIGKSFDVSRRPEVREGRPKENLFSLMAWVKAGKIKKREIGRRNGLAGNFSMDIILDLSSLMSYSRSRFPLTTRPEKEDVPGEEGDVLGEEDDALGEDNDNDAPGGGEEEEDDDDDDTPEEEDHTLQDNSIGSPEERQVRHTNG